MKTQKDLVWDKHFGVLIRFVDLSDIYTNDATAKSVGKLAGYILVFSVKNIINPLSYSFTTFATNGVTEFQIMQTFWKAVCYLEKTNLKVNAATAAGASPNRKFSRVHKLLNGNARTDVAYWWKNIHTHENQFIAELWNEQFCYTFFGKTFSANTLIFCLS